MRDFDDTTPDPHIVFGDIVAPTLIDLIERDPDSSVIEKSLAFLEMIAADPDETVREVAEHSVIEQLTDHPDLLMRLRPKMGRALRRLVRKVVNDRQLAFGKRF